MCLCHKKYFAKSDKCRKLSHRFEMSNDISGDKINKLYISANTYGALHFYVERKKFAISNIAEKMTFIHI